MQYLKINLTHYSASTLWFLKLDIVNKHDFILNIENSELPWRL